MTLAALLTCAASGAQEIWYYVIDVAQPARQVNFCVSEADVRGLVSIFERFGPRTGYSALAESTTCYIAVIEFTPRRIVEEIVIAEGKPEEYRMRFVEGQNENGETLYLVTTREVRDR
ncbi:MAG: hypothetical protein R3286_15060 [Gammaproteobacteria bacterium]|nr:hypothetical protein [Gammaproteobacteria bacterium]